LIFWRFSSGEISDGVEEDELMIVALESVNIAMINPDLLYFREATVTF